MAAEPEQLAAHERQKRVDAEDWYEKELVKREAEMETLREQVEKAKKQWEACTTDKSKQKGKIDQLQNENKELQKKMEKAQQETKMYHGSWKSDQELIEAKESELKEMQKKKAEFFQLRRKAEKELAEERATNHGLHEQLDALEKKLDEAEERIRVNEAAKQQLDSIHSQLEQAFVEVKSENLSTPEYIEKLRQREMTLHRTDSRTSMSSEMDDQKPKKSRLSVGDELAKADLGSQEGSDADEDGDRTLTEGFEVAEMRQKVEELEKSLARASEKEGGDQRTISALSKELEEVRRAVAEGEKQRSKLGMSDIIRVATSPISPTPASPPPAPEPEQQKLRYSKVLQVDTEPISPASPARPGPPAPKTTTLSAEPTWRDIAGLLPWTFWLPLLLSLVWLVYLWATVWAERALWLGANDAVRASAVRIATARRESYCGSIGGPGEGVMTPVWLAVQEWLGLPMPTLLT